MQEAAISNPHPSSVDIVNEHALLLPAGFRNGKTYLHGNVLQFCTVRYLQPTLHTCADNAERKGTCNKAFLFLLRYLRGVAALTRPH